MDLENIQQQLEKENIDGWLLYDFRRSNDLACTFLNISLSKLLTRRYCYWIPKKGKPIKILHKIEPQSLSHLPGNEIFYASWEEFESSVAQTLNGTRRIAMEYSPRNAIPYVSKVDAGTVDLIRSFGIEVVSSADILQHYTSIWNDEQWESHLIAAEVLTLAVEMVWNHLSKALANCQKVTEFDVQQLILHHFSKHHCITDSPPICAVNAHSADPHYMPYAQGSSFIDPNDFVLIDLWCKQDKPNATYADITRVAVASSQSTPRQREIFSIVRQAQKRATDFVIERQRSRTPVMGWEVDKVCRQVITEAGYGKYFIHRTGHNIGTTDHGNGANIDNLETQDCRHLIPRTCFSIEPGIYLPGEFGVRLEYDVYIHQDRTVQVTGGIQDEITCLI